MNRVGTKLHINVSKTHCYKICNLLPTTNANRDETSESYY